MLHHVKQPTGSQNGKLQGSKLAVVSKFSCTASPYTDQTREEQVHSKVKVLHNVPCAKEATSKKLPSMTVTFHQKKAAQSDDSGSETGSTHAQWDDETDQDCYC